MFHTIDLSDATSAGHSLYDWCKDIVVPLVAPLIAVAAIVVAIMLTRAQVRPLHDQISLMREQADTDRQHRENSIAWSISLESLRLSSAAKIRLDASHSVRPT